MWLPMAGSKSSDGGKQQAGAAKGPNGPPRKPGLARRALSLGTANAFDFGIQFLLPVVLARTLDVASFGEYRILWLMIGTLMALAPLAMPQSLYYFLPRSDASSKRLYINQTLVFLACGAAIGAVALSPLNPWLPDKLRISSDPGFLVPAFAFLWVIASLLDLLPTVEERVTWQTRVIVGLSTLRALALSAAALLTGDLGAVLWVLLAFVVFKLTLLAAYISSQHGIGGPVLRPGAFADQVKHAAPFGVSSSLHGMRHQADQWVAAALFSVQMFASFSVAGVLGPMVNLFRQSVNHVFLPSMSRRQAGGDLAGMLALNNRANVMVATLVFPILALAFVFADDIITIIYTSSYVAAAPVMRVYIIGMVAYVVELASIMLLLRQGTFAMTVNGLVLVLSISISWLAALRLGLWGAAVGSVCAVYVDRIVTLIRLSRHTGIPVRRLQDWTPLVMLAIYAAGAGLAAWGVADAWPAAGPMTRLMAGGMVIAVIYGVILLMTGGRQRWLSAEVPAPAVPTVAPAP
jgi:O-antigen/teichoic acid export membrane protein